MFNTFLVFISNIKEAKVKKKQNKLHVFNSQKTEKLLSITLLPFYIIIHVPGLLSMVQRKTRFCYWNSFSDFTLILWNINKIKKLRYFTWWDVPIWRSNIWTTHNSLCFHFFLCLLAQRMCENNFAKFHIKLCYIVYS